MMRSAARMTQAAREPVLLAAALDALAVRPAGCYVDATFGRGGHSAAIVEQLGEGGRLIAFDRDPAAARVARAWQADEPRLAFCRDSIAALAPRLEQLSMLGGIDGMLFDLGVSSPQFDTPERGFSFRHAGPLDMRMDPDSGVSLGEWLATADVADVRRVLQDYGEEPFAGRIAHAVVAARDAGMLTDTAALAAVIRAAVPARVAAGMHIHPATRAFQAFRIHVNGELDALRSALDAAMTALAPGGRLVVISFHSLEDRIVKRFMRGQAQPPLPPLPMVPVPEPALRLIGKALHPDAAAVAANPRARSAVLRVAERTTAAQVSA